MYISTNLFCVNMPRPPHSHAELVKHVNHLQYLKKLQSREEIERLRKMTSKICACHGNNCMRHAGSRLDECSKVECEARKRRILLDQLTEYMKSKGSVDSAMMRQTQMALMSLNGTDTSRAFSPPPRSSSVELSLMRHVSPSKPTYASVALHGAHSPMRPAASSHSHLAHPSLLRYATQHERAGRSPLQYTTPSGTRHTYASPSRSAGRSPARRVVDTYRSPSPPHRELRSMSPSQLLGLSMSARGFGDHW